jgi:hypothetical protein
MDLFGGLGLPDKHFPQGAHPLRHLWRAFWIKSPRRMDVPCWEGPVAMSYRDPLVKNHCPSTCSCPFTVDVNDDGENACLSCAAKQMAVRKAPRQKKMPLYKPFRLHPRRSCRCLCKCCWCWCWTPSTLSAATGTSRLRSATKPSHPTDRWL